MKENLNKTLFLFTAEYPYGNKSETFLETEINFLAKDFKEVIIVPSKKSAFKRPTPENVWVLDEYANLSFSKSSQLIHLFKHPLLSSRIIYSEIQAKGFKKFWKNRKVLIDYLTRQLITASLFEKNKEMTIRNTILYAYWFSNTTLALSVLKNKTPKIKLVTRAHGFDLYDERWGQVGLPFRLFQIKKVDKVFCISQKGQEYFKSKIPAKFHSKIELSYLGVNQHSKLIESPKKDVKTIVSCSSLLPFKNVLGIVDILKASSMPIKWIHFGDGPEKEKVLEKAKELPSNIDFESKGHVNNEEVITFYQNNHVDLFVSLSTSEGLPVSMMEAMSFGIPILSTNVGGIAELVLNEKTGFLVALEDEVEIKRETFNQAILYNFDADEIKEMYHLNFNANNNYTKFTQMLKEC